MKLYNILTLLITTFFCYSLETKTNKRRYHPLNKTVVSNIRHHSTFYIKHLQHLIKSVIFRMKMLLLLAAVRAAATAADHDYYSDDSDDNDEYRFRHEQPTNF